MIFNLQDEATKAQFQTAEVTPYSHPPEISKTSQQYQAETQVEDAAPYPASASQYAWGHYPPPPPPPPTTTDHFGANSSVYTGMS